MNRVFLFFCLIINSFVYSQNQISGVIVDNHTLEELPFVNIAIKGTTQGTVTSLNGKFSLDVNSFPVTIICSYVGYAKREVVFNSSEFKKISLTNIGFNLDEAVVFAGPNPADIIMQKVVKNSDINNPEKNCRFQYQSYNKLVFTINTSLLNPPKDSSDKEVMSLHHFFKNRHIFLSESVTEKKYYSASKNKETILAAKVSGFENPVFTLISTQLQSFHFYKEEIALGDIKFIGPVSKHGLKHYHFILADTFYLNNDTIYSITFAPHKDNNKHSMKGVLQIHTDGYAIYNVSAEPTNDQGDGLGISVSQQYQKINNQQWFPSELNTTLAMNGVQLEGAPLLGIGTTQIKNIEINPEFSKKEFDNVEVEMNEQSIKNSDSQLELLRNDTLNSKEKETYRFIDSLGKANHLDKKMLVINSLVTGAVPIKFLDWDISKLLLYNDYEGLRLGLALKTNYKVTKYASLRGYLAYGFKDKAWKYGYNLTVNISQKNQIGFDFSYRQDVEASSNIIFFDQQRLLMNQGYSNLFMNRFDSISKYEARFYTRALRHFKFHLFGNYQVREAYENYIYRYNLSESVTLLDPTFTLAEMGFEMKMAINEKFIETPFGFISKGSSWPIVTLRYTVGKRGILNSEYDYQRFIIRSEKVFSSLRWGNLSLSLSAGIVKGETPYHLLFNPTGTYKPIQKMTVYSVDGFETIRLNEFLLDQFASLHFKYRFAQPIIKGEKFRPYISLTTTALIGELKNSQIHQNLTFNSINKPFTESGLLIDNLLHSGVSSLGIGAFYRWGNYELPRFSENLAIKISLALSLE